MKRAYEPASKADGYRVLIDRLWPRGLKKTEASFDEWAKELAPSDEARKNFGHDPSRWKQFRAKYRLELRSPLAREKLDSLSKRARRSTITLVYGARDEHYNNAVVLKEILDRAKKKRAVKTRPPRKAA